ncbi:hypothetical protein RFI_29290 [Reticulomyxa filosa]|uniref:Uncharacterized protein n=1 Tax=Reticulomyxa filosa TaxID=46433 RepID=X6M372_RETFI|nr:hypothetical protein RFI_29290 [Reticulomyxa filosa]|eukprot:ETO08101.1 hypothetical protein RFI_29290 [Reticulomyxa filosa]
MTKYYDWEIEEFNKTVVKAVVKEVHMKRGNNTIANYATFLMEVMEDSTELKLLMRIRKLNKKKQGKVIIMKTCLFLGLKVKEFFLVLFVVLFCCFVIFFVIVVSVSSNNPSKNDQEDNKGTDQKEKEQKSNTIPLDNENKKVTPEKKLQSRINDPLEAVSVSSIAMMKPGEIILDYCRTIFEEMFGSVERKIVEYVSKMQKFLCFSNFETFSEKIKRESSRCHANFRSIESFRKPNVMTFLNHLVAWAKNIYVMESQIYKNVENKFDSEFKMICDAVIEKQRIIDKVTKERDDASK